MQELKEQVRMYEMASQCGAVLAGSRSSAMADLDDSYNQLAIKKSAGTVSSSGSVDQAQSHCLSCCERSPCIDDIIQHRSC